MSELILDRQAYADEVEEPIELLDPLPQCAPSRNGVTLMPFQLMTPLGGNVYQATYAISQEITLDGAAIRYGDCRPVYLDAPSVFYVVAGWTMTITLRTNG